jgi:hypothetical protein
MNTENWNLTGGIVLNNSVGVSGLDIICLNIQCPYLTKMVCGADQALHSYCKVRAHQIYTEFLGYCTTGAFTTCKDFQAETNTKKELKHE